MAEQNYTVQKNFAGFLADLAQVPDVTPIQARIATSDALYVFEAGTARGALGVQSMQQWVHPLGPLGIACWPPLNWTLANTYLHRYPLGGRDALHTGHDIDKPGGTDVGETVYAVGEGIIVEAAMINPPSTWGGVIMLICPHDGTFTAFRYGHLMGLMVAPGLTVKPGDPIAYVGRTPHGKFDPHLHFDVGKTGDLFFQEPKNALHWPWLKKDEIEAHYQDPGPFMMDRLLPVVPNQTKRLRIHTTVMVRQDPNANAKILGKLTQGTHVLVTENERVKGGEYFWRHVVGSGWFADKYAN